MNINTEHFMDYGLARTIIIQGELLPPMKQKNGNFKKAFTLAEVLITLSILGVVAALTIPSLVNRQSDLAAQTKLKKAIANYENVMAVYMAENETTSAEGMLGDDCANLTEYFKVVEQDDDNDCNFTTADGVYWSLDDGTGFAAVADSKTAPRYAVTMWVKEGQVNGTQTNPELAELKLLPKDTAAPINGMWAAPTFINSDFKTDNTTYSDTSSGKGKVATAVAVISFVSLFILCLLINLLLEIVAHYKKISKYFESENIDIEWHYVKVDNLRDLFECIPQEVTEDDF